MNNAQVSSTTSPPAFSAPAVEAICRVLADAVTGSQIPGLIGPLKIREAPDDDRNTKWKRLFNAVAQAQNRQQDGRPLVRLVAEVMQPVRFAGTEDFERRRAAVNERLLFSGLEVRSDGKVVRTRAAKTLDEAQQRADALHAELERRAVHSDVLEFCRAELTQRNYFHAVLEASKSVAQKLRNLSGVGGDGSALVDAACGLPSGPIVAFNSLSTDWDRSEQTGLAMLLKGLFSTYRNPSAHAPKVQWATERSEALDMMTLASMLHRRLDDATINRQS